MSSPLNPDIFLSLFPENERESIRSLLISPSGEVQTSRLERLIENYPAAPSMNVAPVSGAIDHKAHNEMLKGLQTDLLRLFQIYGELDQAVSAYDRRSRSLISELASRLNELERKVANLEDWARRPDMEGAPISIDFIRRRVPALTEEDPETGFDLTPEQWTHQDAVVGESVLPIASEINRIRSIQGGQTARLYWVDQRGGLPLEGREGLQFPLDGNPDTAWWARHISNAPVRDPEATRMNLVNETEGVSCTLDLVFASPEPLSELMLFPFGPMGVDILRIECYENEQDSASSSVWVGNDPGAIRSSLWARQPVRISGRGERVHRVRFILGQRHAYMRSLTPEELDQEIIRPVPLDERIESWMKSRGLHTPSQEGRQSGNVRVVYEYLYGLREIRALTRTYQPRAVVISDPIQTSRQLDRISLEVESEPIPTKNSDDAPRSSLRFYVMVGDRNIPILPRKINGKENRTAEAVPLSFSGLGVAALQFPADKSAEESFRLFEDGREVPRPLFQISSDGKTVAYSQFRPESTYWASYMVSESESINGTRIDLSALNLPLIEHTERFGPTTHRSGSGSRIVTISRDPFIDVSRLADPQSGYRPIDVRLIGRFPGTNATIVTMIDPGEDPESISSPCLVNQTNYLTGINQLLVPYAPDRPIYSFRHDGRKIIFGDELSDVIVEVRYFTLSDTLRIGAVLERGPNASSHETPRLRSVRLHPRYLGSFEMR